MSEPIFPDSVWVAKPWAGSRLSTMRKAAASPEKPLGICREICAYKGSENPVSRGKYAGMNLKQIIDVHHDAIMGTDDRDQLLRVAYMDTAAPLSVQVHPDASLAAEAGDYEKAEAWYVLDCEPGSFLYAGTTTVDKAALRLAAENDNLCNYLQKIYVKPGDFITIPAGLIHACGANMLVVETGTFGGITYRIWDYGSTRPLDIEDGFRALHPELTYTLVHNPLRERTKTEVSPGVRHPLFECDVVDIADTWICSTEGRYRVLSVVDSDCVLQVEGTDYPLNFTETVLVPADVKQFTVKGNCRIIASQMPLPV